MAMTRRDFVCTVAGAAAVGLTAGEKSMAQEKPQRELTFGGPPGPIIISSGNGGPACERAAKVIHDGGDPLDAVVAGINVVEDDPSDHSVGYGGLPNEAGVVELDSCVMDGRLHKAGAVAGIHGIRNPSSVALKVMRRTDHVLIVGDGATRFAKAHGFKEENLLTDEARKIWLKWKESHSGNDDWLHPEADLEAARRLRELGIEHTTGTITCMALTNAGDICGCTSTSGLSYKIPGRVGDSPIIGAGLYVDNEVGACGSTGRGEANIQNCSCAMIVEFMRSGMTPEEASLAMLDRVAKKTEPRLRRQSGEANYQLTFYAVRRDGQFGGAAMWEGSSMAMHDGQVCGWWSCRRCMGRSRNRVQGSGVGVQAAAGRRFASSLVGAREWREAARRLLGLGVWGMGIVWAACRRIRAATVKEQSLPHAGAGLVGLGDNRTILTTPHEPEHHTPRQRSACRQAVANRQVRV